MTRLLAPVAPLQSFCTVDDLKAFATAFVEANPGRVERRELGHSREGEPIFELRFGRGEKHALLLGLPHPDEPIGAHALMLLCPMLLAEDRGYTWHVVLFCDPDGSRLNQNWYGFEPLTPLTLAMHYYRPAEIDQFEWTFPIEYKRLHFTTPNPEAQAVLGLMLEVPFHFMMNMHNCTYGGAYLYFSHPAPALADAVYERLAAAGISPHKGVPEVPYLTPLDDRATYKVYGTREVYDHYEAHGVAEPEKMISAGTCADKTVIDKWNSFTFVCELPYFTHPDIGSTQPMDATLAAIIEKGARQRHDDLTALSDLYEGLRPFLTRENPVRHKLDYD
ncbi:MAG: M14 family metallopeptidase, partial [Candidatus Xenobia bacterium]